MKILTPGQPPETYIHSVKCYGCKCEFEFERREGKIVADQRDGDYVEIACPTCSLVVTDDLKNAKPPVYGASGNIRPSWKPLDRAKKYTDNAGRILRFVNGQWGVG